MLALLALVHAELGAAYPAAGGTASRIPLRERPAPRTRPIAPHSVEETLPITGDGHQPGWHTGLTTRAGRKRCQSRTGVVLPRSWVQAEIVSEEMTLIGIASYVPAHRLISVTASLSSLLA